MGGFVYLRWSPTLQHLKPLLINAGPVKVDHVSAACYFLLLSVTTQDLWREIMSLLSEEREGTPVVGTERRYILYCAPYIINAKKDE